MRKWIILPIIVVLMIGGYFSIANFRKTGNRGNDKIAVEESVTEEIAPVAETPKQSFLLAVADVSFTSQAPFGQWADARYQNACEEASILMAMSWVSGDELSPEKATEEIARLAGFQEENYGHFHDRSAQDTAQLIKDYFNYEQVEFKTNITAENVINELAKGNVVIVPVNGQKLNNPNYKPPGPVEHMIIVIGFDRDKNEFIVNDPGTRQGQNYRYSRTVLENALQDYPTGYHEQIAEINKSMITISKI